VFQFEQGFAPFVLVAQPELRFRGYQGVSRVGAGPDTRDDVIFAVTAGLRYNLKRSLGVALEYRFSTIQTDYMTAEGFDPSFARHELIAGVRAAL
jgi:opacity protein-like surface antigen